MRTTLTIDADVAVRIEKIRRGRDASLKEVVNEALRVGLDEIDRSKRDREPFRTRTFRMGEALISIDNVAEALAHAESDDFR